VDVGQHERVVDPGQRLVVGVLEDARGAHRQGVAGDLQEVGQIVADALRQRGLVEALPQLVVL
jgi:hypothetical protein